MHRKKEGKIQNWGKLLDQYYKNTDKKKLKDDLKKSGFQVNDKSID